MSPQMQTKGISDRAQFITIDPTTDVAAGASLGLSDYALLSAISCEASLVTHLEMQEWDNTTWTEPEDINGTTVDPVNADIPTIIPNLIPQVSLRVRIRNSDVVARWIKAYCWKAY